MSHRLRILLVTDNELLAYQLTSALLDRAEITFVLKPGEALASPAASGTTSCSAAATRGPRCRSTRQFAGGTQSLLETC